MLDAVLKECCLVRHPGCYQTHTSCFTRSRKHLECGQDSAYVHMFPFRDDGAAYKVRHFSDSLVGKFLLKEFRNERSALADGRVLHLGRRLGIIHFPNVLKGMHEVLQ